MLKCMNRPTFFLRDDSPLVLSIHAYRSVPLEVCLHVLIRPANALLGERLFCISQ